MNLSSVPVIKLSARHHRIALLKANALTNNKICELTGYRQAWVSIMLADPRVQELVDQYRTEITSECIEEAATILRNETVPTLRKVLEHRDSNNARASLKACEIVLDRTIPTKQQREVDTTRRLVVTVEEVRRIKQSEDEMKIVEAQGRIE